MIDEIKETLKLDNADKINFDEIIMNIREKSGEKARLNPLLWMYWINQSN